MRKIIDLSNQKFGKLTVIKYLGNDKHKKALWLCKCDCGNETVVESSRLRKGHTKSCGCYRNESAFIKSTTHGKSKSRLYKIWYAMVNRCYNPSSESYKSYGARGIKICDCIPDFITFYQWSVNNGYSDELTIERKNVNDNYCICQNNIKWAGKVEQARNTRIHKSNTSGQRGIGFHKASGKFRARICVENKQIHLGTFDTLEEATAARKTAEFKYW